MVAMAETLKELNNDANQRRIKIYGETRFCGNDTWYGMTYHEDVAAVKDSFKRMLENGVYKTDLFSDL